MNRKLLRLGLVLLLCCLLPACAAEPECQHQWREADCVNVKSCTLCGLTEGEALGHSFDKWILEADKVQRVCSVCNEREILEPNGDFLASGLAGTWYSYYQGRPYYITLSEDYSFTADFDGEISGCWQSQAIISGYAELLLSYDKDGEEETVCIQAGYFSSYTDKNDWELYLPYDDSTIRFGFIDEAEFTERVAKADSMLLGSWTSLEYRFDLWDSEESGQSTEYSITFLDDGTFDAKLRDEVSGSWELELVVGNASGTRYRYLLSGGKVNDGSKFEIDPDGDAVLYIYQDGESHIYSMRQMNGEELARQNQLIESAPTMLVGEWFATDSSGSKAVFSDNGSFTLTVGGEEQSRYEGSWTFTEFDRKNDSESSYYHDLESQFGKEERAVSLDIFDGISVIELDSQLASGTMADAESLKRLEALAGEICGHWVADESDDYYLDIDESFSFSGYIGKDVHGSWSVQSYFDASEKSPIYLFELAEYGLCWTVEMNNDRNIISCKGEDSYLIFYK